MNNTFRATSQENVFFHIEACEWFEHPSKHPSSIMLSELQAIGKQVIQPYNPPTYTDMRRQSYRSEITNHEFQEAVIEFLVENKTEKLVAIQARRKAIKDRFPKSVLS
jgi:hypothetical protein